MRKNLIILCTDTMRGDCLAASGRNPDIQTPHMDGLAQRGVNFRQHHTSFPKCCPARISMMTGRYCHTDGYRTIFQLMPADQPNLLASMLSANYQAVLFGVNHCWENLFEATHRPPQLEPGQRGLAISDHSWTGRYAAIYDRWKKIAAEPQPSADLDPQHLGMSDIAHNLEYAGRRRQGFDEAYTEQAIEFLERGRDRDRPFFLQVNIGSPHPPYAVEDPWYSQYDRQRITPFPHALPRGATLPFSAQREVRSGNDISEAVLREIQATYFGMIGKTDHLMGKMIDAIERQGLFENSVVMLWADHGDFAGQYGLIEKWDTVFSDCLTNVPFVLCDPTLPTGKTIDALTDHTDIVPTMTDLLGLEPVPGVHGKSLLPVIAGQWQREAVFADGGHEDPMLARFADNPALVGAPTGGKQDTYRRFPDSMARSNTIRTADHKLVMRLRGGNELYDLRQDPWETTNRFDDPALSNVKCQLLQKLAEWQLHTNTDRPYQKHIGA